MTNILVAGLINLETTLRVDSFPVPYEPVRYPFHGVASTVAGVGYNITKALACLGDDARLLALCGRDALGDLVRAALAADGLNPASVCFELAATPQSVILYDGAGRRQIHVDLKDIQERAYPATVASQVLAGCDVAVLCNINFARPLLAEARRLGKLVATDVHALSDLDDAYNADFMRAADVLFMSHERLPAPPADWARQVRARYGNRVVIIGRGEQGALLSTADGERHFPAVYTRPVVNTIGAGDALLSAFVHAYACHADPARALRQAQVFASYKCGAAGAADGFLSAGELETWVNQSTSQSVD